MEVWSGGGLSATQFALTHGCGAGCSFGASKINGSDYITTVDSSTNSHAYFAVRGDRVIVFSYIIGSASEQPTAVSEETLNAIVQFAGLP